ncbi:MAG: HD domain-containing protein [Deltaproteobacteria bacterium]|nr:HD domain-containing protein [Deltaproteobacteria bacterium]
MSKTSKSRRSKHEPRPLSPKVGRALQLAFELHRRQLRKGSGVPYLAHLLGVASTAMRYGATESEAIAALLHDAIEDQGGKKTRARLRRLFGARVTGIVDECTDTDLVPKPPWRARKEAYIRHLASASKSALLVSAADKLDNARDLLADHKAVGDALWERFAGGKAGTLWYYRSLITAFRRAAAPEALVNELDLVVTQIERRVAGSQPSTKRIAATTRP